ncbi:MAG: F0F1 ATP synthase subunit A [Acidimicrobiia bacterium]
MDIEILAFECETETDVVCTPPFVNELFETHDIFEIFGVGVNRAMLLMFVAAFAVMAILFFALRKRAVVPSKFGAAVEGLLSLVKDEIATGIIGPQGAKYAPYLISIFLFILVGNLMEVTPFINFPITSRMALPAFLAIVTWVIFVFAGFKEQGLGYVGHIVWPKDVPLALRWLVGIIELVSIFLVRPFSLAVRLFANMVAGHVMLTLLLVTGYVYIVGFSNASFNAVFGALWWVMALAIFLFEVVVSILQAYIFTLLSAVYIQTSVHPEH